MRLDHLKEEYPGMPEEIRSMIHREVEKQLMADGEPGEPIRRGGKISWKKAVIIALAATMVLGTTVFAGVQVYQWHMEKVGNYGLKAEFGPEEADGMSETAVIPEEIPVLSIQAGYLPEGMVQDEGASKYFYPDTPYQGGISIAAIAMDESFTGDQLPVSDTDVTDTQTLTLNGREAIYLEKHWEDNAYIDFDKKIYLACPEYWQILEIFIGEDVTKEEALKVAEQVILEPTGESIPLEEAYTWSEYLSGEEAVEEEDKLTASFQEMSRLHQIGEPFTINTFTSELEEVSVEAKVSQVQLADDFELLNGEYVDSRMQGALGEDGKLIKNVIQYMKSGDGIDTLDETIRTEEVEQKLVYVTVEFTNTGEEDLRDVMFAGDFLGITKGEDGYSFYDRARDDGDDTTDYFMVSSPGGFGEMDYYDVRGGERSNNYIPSIKSGETVQVHMAKIANADELDKMYLSLDPEGGTYEFTEGGLETGYVKLVENGK